ncbi:guanine nucleotide-binding 3-like [Diplodia corticola]|uniref:Guanine nucleotide-binding 3-like n=1 Tax=Diplodia corticola TaxID=236234 RepID=A0A1J9RVN2_9PEZI|nr:guanine nucleotide-binding 3-like [Diplodia corticola]OJD36667.1 guanine nucleotide-binding 3-like [Diplodia corticola]
MARFSGAPARDHDSDNEVLKPDFLDGITYTAQDSPGSSSVDGENDNAVNSEPMHEDTEDDPNSQLLREADTNPTPTSSHKRTDEEQAALLNSTLIAHSRRPAPLPSRPARRAASREGYRATSTPHRSRGPARPDVYELPADFPPSSPTPVSLQSEAQHEHAGESNARHLRSTTRAQKASEPKENEAVPSATTVSEAPKKRKPGRPRKDPTAARIIIKRQNEEAGASKEGDKRIKRKSSMATTPSNSQTSKSTPRKAQTATEKLSRMQAKVANVQEAPLDDGQMSDAPSDRHAANSTTESCSSDDESNDDSDMLHGLQRRLRRIKANKKGVKKVLEKRDEYELKENNESTKFINRICHDLQKELKGILETSTVSIEIESVQVSEGIRSLARKLSKFDLANGEEIKKFLFQDLYAFIFPCLLETLCSIVNFYVNFLTKDGPPDKIPTSQLTEVAGVMAAIINLDTRAKKSARESNVQVPTHLSIVRPTRHNFIAPLKTLHHRLVQLVARQNEQEERNKALRAEQRRLERANLRRQQEAEEKAQERAFLEDWGGLHIARKEVEPDVRRWHHLDFVPLPSAHEPEVIRDLDVNGQPFDRVVMFHHARNPLRRQNLDDEGVEWTDWECLALMEALAKYTAMEFPNPRYTVYLKIIKKHCGPGGALRRFNVSEIVRKSQYFKLMLEDREWTRLIPTF